MFKPLSVTALGSCRIVNPMRIAAQDGAIILNNTDVYGYLHTAREVRQFLDFRDGLKIPAEIMPYLSGARVPQTTTVAAEPRVYLVEISSLKVVMLGDWVLQLNYFTERFRAYPELLKVLYGSLAEDQRDRRTLELLHHAGFGGPAAFDRHVLVNVHVATTARADLEREVLEIVARLPRPVIFVTHCNIPDAHGHQMEHRVQISTWMAEIGQTHGLRVFDPTPHVFGFGIEAAMAEEGASRAHYSPAFEKRLTDEFLHEIRLAAASPDSTARVSAVSKPVPVPPPPLLVGIPSTDGARTHLMAAQLMRTGDLVAASALARAAIAADPPCAAGISVLAQVALRQGEAAAALDYALQARAANSRSSASIVTAAKALTKLKRFEEAADLWREMAACRRNAIWPLIEAARCHLRAKQPEKSLDLAAEVLARDPQDAVALAIKAEALRVLGRMEELPAVAEALAASTPEAALAIMQWMIAAGRVEGLTRVARKVASVPEGVPEAHRDEVSRQLKAAIEHALAHQFWEIGAEALRAYLVFHPSDREATRSLAKLTSHWLKPARIAAKAGDMQTAAMAYDFAVRIDPEQVRTLREAASASEKRAAWDRAADLWDQIVRAGVTDVVTLTRAARAADLADKPERALQLYRSAIDVDPDNTKAQASAASLTRRLAKRARVLEEAGEIDEAVRYAGVVLAANPEEAICSRLLRRSGTRFAVQLKQAVAEGDAPRQEELAIRLLQIDPERFEALRVLSKARLTSKRFDEAEPLLRRLTMIQSDVAAHWVKLGRCLRLMKSYDAARDAAHEALARDPQSPAAHKILADLGERNAS